MMPFHIYNQMRHDHHPAGLAAPWGPSGPLKNVRFSANFVYRFETTDGERFLQVSHEAIRPWSRIQQELSTLDALASAGLRVMPALSPEAGDRIQTLPPFHATVFAAAPGRELAPKEIDAGAGRAWGVAMAALHAHAPRELPRHHMADDLMDLRRWLPPTETELLELADAIAEQLPTEDVGLIHHDFQPDNLRWADDGVWAFDFDDCAHYPRAAELAFSLHYYRDEPERLETVAAWIAEGYRTVRPLPAGWREQIRLFFRLRELWHLAMILHGHQDGDPDWIDRLIADLRRRVIGA